MTAPRENATAGRHHSVFRLLNPLPYVIALQDLFHLIRGKRRLIATLARRELLTEHGGKSLGAIWGLVQPIILFGVYAAIFGIVFQVRIGRSVELPRDYTVYLLAGLTVWLPVQLLMAKSCGSVADNATIVKQTVFDVSLLPLASAITACIPLLCGAAFVVTYTLIVYAAVPWTYLILPLALLLLVMAMAGIAFILSSLGVFFRDVKDFIQIAALVLIFIAPILYLPSAIPNIFEPLIWVNPFSYMVWTFQDILYYGRIEHPVAWIVFGAGSLLVFTGGFRLFERLRPFFGNVL